jgi:hypothetical protein
VNASDTMLASRGSTKPVRAEDSPAVAKLPETSRTNSEPKEAKTTDTKSSDGVATRETQKTTRNTPENSTPQRDTGTNGTKPATSETVVAKGRGEVPPADKPAVAKPAEGTLSVFFLGGVGEFFVNGKRFVHQPPFEKASLPAGSYRMACRMSGDAAPKEIVVSIKANRETVIEYELGRDPVATTE